MRKLLILLILLGMSWTLKAQQPYFFSQFYEVAPAFNPAFTGINNFTDVKIVHRNQWTGFADAPTTNYIGIYSSKQNEIPLSIKEYSLRISNPHLYDSILSLAPKIKDKIKHGYGGNIIYDIQSPFSQFKINLNYSAHLNIGNNSTFAFALNVGVNNQRLDLDKIELRNPDEDLFYQSMIAQGGKSTLIEFNPGILYYTPTFYLGYSAGNLANISLEESDLTKDATKMTHYMQGGFQTPLGELLRLQTSIFYYYYDNNVNSLDVNVKLNMNDKGYFGTSYRTTKDVIFMAGAILQKKFRIGYSYDMKVSGKNDLNNGSHELTLGLMLSNENMEVPYTW